MTRRSRLAATLLALAFVLAAAPAAGYVTLKYGDVEPTWAVSTVRYYLNSSGSDDVPDITDLEASIQAAFGAWDAITCARIAFTYGGRRSSDPEDGIYISFKESNWDPTVGDAAAYAMSWKDWSGNITNAVVVFNGVDSHWTTDAGEAASGYESDIQGVGAHEIGHTLGLDHTRHLEATMFYSSSGNAEMRTLEDDDQRGLCYLYPTGSFTIGQPCDSCTTDAQCATGDCLNYGAPDYFCGQACTTNANCPDDYFCYTTDGINQCVPDNGYCHDAGQNVPMGGYCYGYDVCESGLVCLPVGDDAYCSRTCTTSCPSPYVCLSGYCLRSGGGQMGDPCDGPMDCESLFCATAGPLHMVCSKECTTNGECPGGRCTAGACFIPGGQEFGTTCTAHTDCQSALCSGSSGGRWCSFACTPGDDSRCPDGATCLEGGYCSRPPAQTGDPCQRASDCPTAHFCLFSAQGVASGSCAKECNPFSGFGCAAGEVCAWAEMAWLSVVKGSCVTANGGGVVGDPCDAASPPCELDLVCVTLTGEGPTCLRDCHATNTQGCAPRETCQPLGGTVAPTRGYCLPDPVAPPVDVVTPPPVDVVGPPPDEGSTPRPDTGNVPSPDNGTTPPGPDTGYVPPGADLAGVDGGPVPSVDAGLPGTDGGAGGGGCAAGGSAGGPWALLLLLSFVAVPVRHAAGRSRVTRYALLGGRLPSVAWRARRAAGSCD